MSLRFSLQIGTYPRTHETGEVELCLECRFNDTVEHRQRRLFGPANAIDLADLRAFLQEVSAELLAYCEKNPGWEISTIPNRLQPSSTKL